MYRIMRKPGSAFSASAQSPLTNIVAKTGGQDSGQLMRLPRLTRHEKDAHIEHEKIVRRHGVIIKNKKEFIDKINFIKERINNEASGDEAAPAPMVLKRTQPPIARFGQPIEEMAQESVLRMSTSKDGYTDAKLDEINHIVYDHINTIGYEGEFYVGDTTVAPSPLRHINLIQSTESWGGLRFILEIDNDSVVEFKTPAFIYENTLSGSSFSSSILKKGSKGSEMLSAVGAAYNTDFELTPNCAEKIFMTLFESEHYSHFKKDSSGIIRGLSQSQIAQKTERMAGDLERWESGLRFYKFIASDKTALAAIANKLTQNITANESRTVQVNRGISYKDLVGVLITESDTWNASKNRVDEIKAIASNMSGINFHTSTLQKFNNSFRGFIAHCALALSELKYRNNDEAKNVGVMVHPKTSPEDGFGMLPHLNMAEFNELRSIIRSELSVISNEHANNLVKNLSAIQEIRQNNEGKPLTMSRLKDSRKRQEQSVCHTMNRPDTRVPVPVTRLENGVLQAGVVLELRDVHAPINRVMGRDIRGRV